ncbi:MAG: hypothetical protein C0415_06025 [Thermodesulfovibrio sp.]|nr:hypothetical protein [Thermodesulfovibrio sp.]
MNKSKLAIFSGDPVRIKEFRSKPFITEEMMDRVVSLMREGRLTRFIGSPVPGTKEIIELKSIEAENIDYVFSVLGGASVRKLESDWSKIFKVDYSIAVNSATSGLITAILSLDIEPGDEVICAPFSFTASATSIIAANAIPIFADIDLETFCLSPVCAEKSITHFTRAIMPIHWNSNAGELDALLSLAKNNGLKVVEDAAQSPGMLYKGKFLGTHGDVGVISLNEPKNIMTGEGGIIVTDDKDIAVKCRLIRNHGEAIVDKDAPDKLLINCIGYNFRLVELLAEIGCVQLEHIDYLNNIRKENYNYLVKKLIDEFGDHLIPQRITHVESYFPYTAGFRWISKKSKIHRNTVAAVLRAEGIPAASGISRLMSDNPMFQRQIAYGKNHYPFSYNSNGTLKKYSIPEMPNARRLQDEEYLGFFQIGWPNAIEDMDDIVRAFRKIMGNKNALIDFSGIEMKKTFISGR